MWSFYVPERYKTLVLTDDEASQHSHAQCDGKGKGLDASLFGCIDASVGNSREDVCHSERETRILLRTRGPHVSSP